MDPAMTLQAIPLYLWLGGLYYFLPAVLLAGIFLFVPLLRRNPVSRTIGFIAAFIAALFPISGAVVFLQFGGFMLSQSVSQASRTHHLRTPETLAGVLFPAGSTIVLEKDHPDFIESGKLPAPTVVHGYTLIGDFTMLSPEADDRPGALSGTLAQPATIAGIPCGAAAININSTFTSCILAQDFTLGGFNLQRGSFVQARLGSEGKQQLEQATLATPTLLVDTLYPAGTMMLLSGGDAASLAHLDARHNAPNLNVCLTTGNEVMLGGARVRGAALLQYSGQSVNLDRFCNLQSPDYDNTEKGMPEADLNGTRFNQGYFTFATGKWDGLNNDQTPEME